MAKSVLCFIELENYFEISDPGIVVSVLCRRKNMICTHF